LSHSLRILLAGPILIAGSVPKREELTRHLWVTSMPGDSTLRHFLDDAIATHAGTCDDAWRKVVAHGNHQVWPVVRDSADGQTFNCYTYALMIERDRMYKQLMQRKQSSVLANSLFVEKLAQVCMIVPQQSTTYSLGDMVLYYAGRKLAHAARVAVPDGALRSKWGTGYVYEHQLWEVPAPYGDTFNVARAPSPLKVIEALQEWALAFNGYEDSALRRET
jgi:hypothetical protein